MLVNFALDCVNTEVSCDKVSSDGYEPSNLLHHGGGWHRRQGFLAEGFIKPPVTVTLTFPCPVNLSHVVLDPQVGSQRSSVIEIYTAVHYRMQKVVKTSERHGHTSAPTDETNRPGGGSDATGNTSVSELEPIFKRVGSIRCLEPGQICFHNPRFLRNPSSTEGKIGSHQHRSELHHHQWMMLSAVEFLAVRILYTVNGSVAAIGRLEVWGQPARTCPPQLREDVLRRYARAVGLPAQHSSDVNDQKTGVKGGKKGDSSWNSEKSKTSDLPPICPDRAVETRVDIPDEFLDQLTFEIMSIPMLLPSGHSIDVFTLDRFSDAEATYGRQPSDPFTGLTFTSTRQPVLNETLKMRIDRFLSEHADEPSLQFVPRALGRAVQRFPKTIDSDNTREGHAKSVDRRTGSSVQNLKRSRESVLQHTVPQTCVQMQNAQHNCFPDTSTIHNANPSNKKVKTEKETTSKPGSSGTQITSCSGPVTSSLSGPITVFNKKVKIDKQTTSTTTSKPGSSGTQISSCSGPVTCSSGPITLTSNKSHEECLRSSLSNSLSSVLRGLPSFSTPAGQQPSPATVPCPLDQCSSCRVRLGQANAGTRAAEPSAAYMLPCQHLVCRGCLVATGSVHSVSVTCGSCHRQFARADVVRTHV